MELAKDAGKMSALGPQASLSKPPEIVFNLDSEKDKNKVVLEKSNILMLGPTGSGQYISVKMAFNSSVSKKKFSYCDHLIVIVVMQKLQCSPLLKSIKQYLGILAHHDKVHLQGKGNYSPS